ncbi:TraB/GumN family protein [Xanthocytophaga agilis]|uniref:TraB/GumN family protein n=1 Tax=Xanthocytophaga agilis TaxID=3048010 RepID=A0AAE3UK24_9BACT|nr:TraB/GumN family protein [Xanthocytophaga agilis]MDJ1506133.1 TraB/GumN family protein [Xanthocytophaga agilis]
MLKKALVTLLIFCSSTVFSQDHPNTILWEVSKAGLKHKSYVFGTFHEVYPSFFLSQKNAVQKLSSSSMLYVEQARKDFYDSGTTNANIVTWDVDKWKAATNPEQRKVFESFVQKAENTDYYNLPPLLLSLTLFRVYAQNFCDTANRDSDESLDHYIERLAETKNIPVESLDDKDKMDEVFSSNSLADSVLVEACVGIMRSMLEEDFKPCQIFDTYKNLTINYELSKDLTDKNNHLALLERNRKWVKRLDKAFQKNSCFVAVGFRHLMYRQGLIQQLRDVGYSVKPVPST